MEKARISDTIQPAVVLNSQAIEQRGFVNAADALNELPQFGIPGSSPVGPGQGGAFGTGQSFVNFLGLGSQRTLVLVNSRRFISSNTASIFGAAAPGEQVDIAQINTKLIDRIETIAVGGAPIYGSDTIAGTINIVLKHDYQGFDLDAEESSSNQADAHNWRIRALVGHNFLGGRANLTASLEYNKGKGFVYNDRARLANGLFYDNCPPGSLFIQCLYKDVRVNATVPGGVPLVGSAFGLDFAFSPLQGNQLIGAPFTTGVPVRRERTSFSMRAASSCPSTMASIRGATTISRCSQVAATASRTFAIRPRHCRIQSGTIPTCSAILSRLIICGSSPRVGIHTARARTSQHSRNITAVFLTVRARLPAALSSVSTTRS